MKITEIKDFLMQVIVPERPGLGVDIDEAFIAQHPSTRNCRLPITDGAGADAPGTEAETMCFQSRQGRHHY